MKKETPSIPYDIEAEQAVLGSIIEDNELMFSVADILNPTSFYKPSHQHIFRAMLYLSDTSQPVDEILLGDQLRALNQLDECGGYAYIAELVDCVPSSGNIVYYAKIIQEHSLLRDLICVASDIGRKSRDPEQNVSLLLMEAETKIQEIASHMHGSEVRHIKDILAENFQELEELSKKENDIIGIKTGFKDLDRITCGMLPSDYIVIAARPSMGKTALALNIAEYAAIHDRKPGAIYFSSIESKDKKLVKRLLSSNGRINGHFLKTGNCHGDGELWDRLSGSTEKLSSCEIYFNDKAKDIDQVIYSARSTHRRLKHGLKLFIIDYMQLVKGHDDRSREREVAEISSKLNNLAKELDIPVIALSQLNRALENRSDKHPQLSDIRDSGSIEQDADVIMFIYRDDVYKMKTDPNYHQTNIADIIIPKNRDGPIGDIELIFQGNYTRFVDKT